MSEKLTACKDCKHYVCLHPSVGVWVDVCECRNVPGEFDPLRGEFNNWSPRCIQINHDGHCPHFEAKE